MQSLSHQTSCHKSQTLGHALKPLRHMNGQTVYCNNLAARYLKYLPLQILVEINWQRIALILFLFFALTTHTAARAEQWFFSDPLVWDANFMFDGSWRDSEISPGNIQDSKELRYREQLSFKKRVYFMDPGIATFSFDLRPTFSQSDYSNTDNTNSESDSSTLNYAAHSSFLHGTKIPLSLTAGINRTNGITDGSLGSRTDFDMKRQDLTLNLKNIYFPSQISYTKREQDLVRESGFGTTTSHTSDSIQRWNYRGRSSKMNLDIERLEYNDIIYDRSYTYDREQLNHTFGWGKKSHLRSRFEHAEQKDFGAYQNTAVTEDIRLQHTQRLFSSYQYAYRETKRTVNTTSHFSNINVNHQLYSNLTTQLGYQQNISRYENGTSGKSITTGPRYSLSYNKKLPMKKSNIALGFSGSQLETEQAGGTQLIDVINYSGTFETDRVILNQQYIDITTIEVANSTTGAIYIEGTDYSITQAPSGYTEIYRIDAAGGGNISLNEAVVINFSHWSPGNRSHHAGHFIRLNIDNFQIYYNQSRNDQKLNLSPENLTNVTFPSGFLPETHTKESSAGISYNLTKEKFKLGLGIETRSTWLDNYEAQSRTFNQNIAYTFNPLTSLTFKSSQKSMDTTLSDADSISASANLNMRIPSSRMTVKPHLSYRQQNDSFGNDDRYINEGVDFEWRYYLITFTASLNHYQWNSTTRNNDENRLMFNLIRRSR